MKSILEALFKGEIDVMEMFPLRKRESPDYNKEFVATLTAQQQELYEKDHGQIMSQCLMENQDCFMIGFKMAVQMILESMSGITKEKDT